MVVGLVDKKLWAGLLLVLSCAMGLSVYLLTHTDAIAKDGIFYINMAQQWGEQPQQVIESYDFHVGYPVVIHWAHQLMTGIGFADEPALWDLAGQIVSVIFGLIALIGLWAWGALVWNKQAGFIAALLFGVTYRWSVISCDVISDAAALCMMIWAVVAGYLTVRQIQRSSKYALVMAMLAGVLAGLGYLVRPEAMVVTIMLVIVLVVNYIIKRRSFVLSFGAGGCAIVTSLLVALPYMIAIGDVSKKKSLFDLLDWAMGSFGDGSGLTLAAVVAKGQWLPAFWQAEVMLTEAMHPMLYSFWGIWLATWFGFYILRLPLPRSVNLMPNKLALVWIGLGYLLLMPLAASLQYSAGYLDYRHVMMLGLLNLPLAGMGVLIIVNYLKELCNLLHLGDTAARGVTIIFIGFLVIALVNHAWRPLHEGGKVYRKAGVYISQNTKQGELVLVDNSLTLHYAQQHNSRSTIEFITKRQRKPGRLIPVIIQQKPNWLILQHKLSATLGTKLEEAGYQIEKQLTVSDGKVVLDCYYGQVQ